MLILSGLQITHSKVNGQVYMFIVKRSIFSTVTRRIYSKGGVSQSPHLINFRCGYRYQSWKSLRGDKRWAASRERISSKSWEKITLVLCMHEFIGTCRPDVNVLRKAISKKWPPDNGGDSGISRHTHMRSDGLKNSPDFQSNSTSVDHDGSSSASFSRLPCAGMKNV